MSVPRLNPLPSNDVEPAMNPLHYSLNTGDDHTIKANGSASHQLESNTNAPMNGHGDPHGDAHGSNIPDYDPNEVLTGVDKYFEQLFKIRQRRSSIKLELQCGVIQFISCLYILPVVPQQMARASYDKTPTIVATSAACCIGCIIAAFLTNLPFIIAPPTSVSIFLAVYLQQHNMQKWEGNAAVAVSGAIIVLIGFRPLGRLVAKLIPGCIQASTSVGIGLITALAGATECNLVVRGRYTILDMGPITSEVIIAMLCLVLLFVLLHYHIKGAFCIALVVGSLVSWMVTREWPEEGVEAPFVEDGNLGENDMTPNSCLLFFNLVFLYVLTLNGLARSLSDLAVLTKADGTIPHGRWLYIVCGFTTMISGFMSGPPILISPESAAGIKAGAKTGLSTLVCGALFGLACFFSPLFAAVPGAGTSPLLLAVGVVLFRNTARIDWLEMSEALPAFCVLFFIPFTYSILRGIAFGYVTYLLMGMGTGTLYYQMKDLYQYYRGVMPTDVSGVVKTLTVSRVVELVVTSMDINDHDQEVAFEDLVAQAKEKAEAEDTVGGLPPGLMRSPSRRMSVSRDRVTSVSSGDGAPRAFGRRASTASDGANSSRPYHSEGMAFM